MKLRLFIVFSVSKTSEVYHDASPVSSKMNVPISSYDAPSVPVSTETASRILRDSGGDSYISVIRILCRMTKMYDLSDFHPLQGVSHFVQ